MYAHDYHCILTLELLYTTTTLTNYQFSFMREVEKTSNYFLGPNNRRLNHERKIQYGMANNIRYEYY